MYYDKTRIPAKELKIGMYVSDLDRPWLETPFLFQGFIVETEDMIRELQEYCESVYIIESRFDESIAKRPKPAAKPAAARDDGLRQRQQVRANGRAKAEADAELFDATRDLTAELGNARAVHTKAQATLDTVFARFRSGQAVDVRTIQKVIAPMVESIYRNDDALSWLARMKKKNDYVYDHSMASAVWAMVFAKHLNLERKDIETIGLGAMLMDVGKTQIPDELLAKKDHLTEEETKIMRKHVEHGVSICKNLHVSPAVLDIIQSHHERHNGTGYPARLEGNSIPVFARIAGIVDSFDAMTTPRPYAAPVSTADAMRSLNDLAGVEFQAEMVEQFVQAVGVFPVGALVELSSGEVAVIIAQNRVRRLRPQVMILTDPDKTLLKKFRVVDLRNQLVDAAGQSLWIQRGLPSDAYGIDTSELFI